ncbi:MAG: FimB/Mfa2 family fimbrial subunit [Candidatus Amulumruptor caecigallinarius]|nr:FimB/Mfa2 family fimbrial subunit [Candidatus Amulumruptor caecigallinarius]
MTIHNMKSVSGRIGKSARGLMMLCMAIAAMLSLSSCDKGMGVYDDLAPCPSGMKMRFVFDYNLEFANSFHNQVDCLSVYVFDKAGNLVESRTETTEVLADENWRMTFDLPAAEYQVVAYGGLECELASFAQTVKRENVARIEDLRVLINEEHIGDEAKRPARPLHDLYHGYLAFEVTNGLDYNECTVKMMRDTNHIRIVLQHIDNSPVDDRDFRFEIVDDNVLLNHMNDVVPRGTVTYTPWTTGTANTGVSRGEPVQVAFAELSTSRLMRDSKFVWTDPDGKSQNGPRLRITSVKNGRMVCDLPLNNYLVLMKSEYLAQMGEQEFLDRANRYNMVFFLDKDNFWVQMNIIVNDWTVRIDNIKFQ